MINWLNGTWRVCYKQAGGGLWTLVGQTVPYNLGTTVGPGSYMTPLYFTVISFPSFSPLVGVAGSVTPITFSGSVDGDYIVLQTGDCNNAHSTQSSTNALAEIGRAHV